MPMRHAPSRSLLPCGPGAGRPPGPALEPVTRNRRRNSCCLLADGVRTPGTPAGLSGFDWTTNAGAGNRQEADAPFRRHGARWLAFIAIPADTVALFPAARGEHPWQHPT